MIANSKKPERLLLVDRNPKAMQDFLTEFLLSKYDIALHTARTGMEALEKYKTLLPGLIIISCDLPDINGMSVSTIIKDGQNGHNTTIYLYNVKDILDNTKADHLFNMSDSKRFRVALKTQVENFYQSKLDKYKNSMEYLKMRNDQYSKLSTEIDTPYYKTVNIFSAFEVLSGDFYEYWQDPNDTGNLYGFLFDCPGHDLFAYSIVRSVRMSLKKDMQMMQLGVHDKLSDVFKNFNEDLYAIDASPETIAAIIFKLDIQKGVFNFCTAGMPGIYLKKIGSDELSIFECRNFILGYIQEADYDDYSIPLDDLDSIIICSDGLWEVAFNHEEVAERGTAKHDDVSGVIIKIKENLRNKFHADKGNNTDNN